jgi:ABC-type oligopeptide transport system ATPase subunit
MIELLQQVGFKNAAARRFFESFAGTNKERVAAKYQVRGANFIAYK